MPPPDCAPIECHAVAGKMISTYQLKTRFQTLLRPLAGQTTKMEHHFVYRKDERMPALAEFRKLLEDEKQACEKKART